MPDFSMPEDPTESSTEEPIVPAVASALSGTAYSQLSQSRLNNLISKLRDAKVEEALKVLLPKIVVIGKQSSGKSSLVEAISKIRLPRAEGTCTRCPMEVRLSTSASYPTAWECKVSVERPDNIHFFDYTRDGDGVEEIVKRAQMAVLLDDEDLEKFKRENFSYHRDDFASLASTKFSENKVILDITGADVDLTFIDLPGLFEYDEVRVIVEVLF